MKSSANAWPYDLRISHEQTSTLPNPYAPSSVRPCGRGNDASIGNFVWVALSLLGWLRSLSAGRDAKRRLQVADTVSLGEKRFVAVVQVDGRHFLLAGGPTNIALLAQLNEKDDFGEVLKKTMTVPVAPPSAEALATANASASAPAARAVAKRVRAGKKETLAKAPIEKKIATPPPAPRRAKATTAAAKASAVPPKKESLSKRRKKPAAEDDRFGGIPPTEGVRAFDAWLGRAMPVAASPAAILRGESGRSKERGADSANKPVSLPNKSPLHESLADLRASSEKHAVPPIPVVAKPSAIEEYA